MSDRKNRACNHLLARFAEEFADYSLVALDGSSTERTARVAQLVQDKQAFLRRYPRISAARGTGFDVLTPGGDGELSGLEERIRLRLGLQPEEYPIVIEHVLLGPIAEDVVPPGELGFQHVPLLAGILPRDPYSLQVSFVFQASTGRFARQAGNQGSFRALVEHTVREETPAHLTAYVHWLSDAEWSSLAQAHLAWRDTYREYRRMKVDRSLMTDPQFLRIRDARDRLVELLGLGEPYPLRDVPVDDTRLTVPFDQSAHIPILFSQLGVEYQLVGKDDAVVATGTGNGGALDLATPPMTDDFTFTVLASKVSTGRSAYLQSQATVKVGLDLALPARILDGKPLPQRSGLTDDDPRLVAWGTAPRVQIDRAQEGVDYHLVQIVSGTETAISPVVRGDRTDIQLVGSHATEDTDLRIRATKQFNPSENRPTQSDLLNLVLPLKVMAQPDLVLSLDPAPVFAFGDSAGLRIEGTQASVQYQAYLAPVADSDFVFGSSSTPVVRVVVPGDADVTVIRPPIQQNTWLDVPGFLSLGAATPGNGGTLPLALGALTDDTFVIVKASKTHQVSSGTVESAVQLTQAVVALTRPDPDPGLQLSVVMAGNQTDGTLEFSGGQAGVFYFASIPPDTTDLGLPAYFHKLDATDSTYNKGVGQLRLEVDFAVAAGANGVTSAELPKARPLPPVVATPALDGGTTLAFRAVKAQTRVAATLAKTAQLDGVPKIVLAVDPVPLGDAATVVVAASVVGERYDLTLNGQSVGQARDGDGTHLNFDTAPITSPTLFELRVTQPGAAAIPVVRRVAVSVSVQAPPVPVPVPPLPPVDAGDPDS